MPATRFPILLTVIHAGALGVTRCPLIAMYLAGRG